MLRSLAENVLPVNMDTLTTALILMAVGSQVVALMEDRWNTLEHFTLTKDRTVPLIWLAMSRSRPLEIHPL